MILLFAILILLFSVCSLQAQEFVSINDSSLYPAIVEGSFIPPSSDYAILKWTLEPPITDSTQHFVTSASIIPKYTVSLGNTHSSAYGFNVSDDQKTTIYTIISAENMYTRSSNEGYAIPARYLTAIQNILTSKRLGTVSQRAVYIRGFNLGNVKLIDVANFQNMLAGMLGPWVKAALGLVLALFIIDIGSRNTTALAGDAAKEARNAERREINRQIRNDTTAQVYRARLDYLAQVKSKAIYDSEISPRKARGMFEDAARDYAEYKRSMGWAR